MAADYSTGYEVKESKKMRKNIWIIVVAILVISIIGLQLYFLGIKGKITGNAIVLGKDEAKEETIKIVSLEDEEKYILFWNIIKLEATPSSEKLQFARYVNTINTFILRSKNSVVVDAWEDLTQCFNKKCENFPTFQQTVLEELFGTVAEEKSMAKRVLRRSSVDYHLVLREALILRKAATQNDVIAISRSVDYINGAIMTVNDPKVTDKWNTLLDCDYTCDKYNEFLLTLTEKKLE